MKNEPYNPNIRSEDISEELNFIKAHQDYIDDYVDLTLVRNPTLDRNELLKKARKEINESSNGIDYGLYFAIFSGKLVGFCRFFTSEGMPKEKIKYPHPKGVYCMGIIIHPEFRRKGIAKFLAMNRFKILKELGCSEAFSVVAKDNPSSIKMHKSFGFAEIDRGPGFFTVSFDCGEGILFRKPLK